MTAAGKAPRGRPREFDLDAAIARSQALFHDRGYDAVSVAALTEAIGIYPPSFYSAFGSKAALFEQVMDRYASEGLKLEAFATPERGPSETLQAYLASAARLYARHPCEAGCLILEAARGVGDVEGTISARSRKEASRERVRAFVGKAHPAVAGAVADLVVVTMSGLSAAAREGWREDRLLAIVETIGRSLAGLLP